MIWTRKWANMCVFTTTIIPHHTAIPPKTELTVRRKNKSPQTDQRMKASQRLLRLPRNQIWFIRELFKWPDSSAFDLLLLLDFSYRICKQYLGACLHHTIRYEKTRQRRTKTDNVLTKMSMTIVISNRSRLPIKINNIRTQLAIFSAWSLVFDHLFSCNPTLSAGSG